MMKKITITIIIISGLAFMAHSQQIPINNQYLINKFSLSPAYAGYNENLEAFISYRKNWVGVTGAPRSLVFNINGAVNEKMGLGGTVINEQVGIFSTFSALVCYAYHLKLSGKSSLSIGVDAGLFDSNIDLSKSNTQGSLDPVIMSSSDMSKTVFDAGAGILLRYQKLNIGLAIPRLIQSTVESETTDSSIYTFERHYRIHLSYSIDLNRNWQIDPHVVLMQSQNSPMFYDVAALIKYQQRLWVGTTYRKGSSFGLSLGGIVHDRVAMNYSYEFGGGGVLGNSSGTHEFSLGFLIGKNKGNPSSIFNPASKQPYYDWN